MEERILIYDDTAAAEKEINSRKALNASIIELKISYELLRLKEPFTRELFLKLVDEGVKSLVGIAQASVNEFFERNKAPVVLYGALHFDSQFNGIQEILTSIKRLIRVNDIDIFTVRFNGSKPEFTEQDEDEVRERHRHYAENAEDKELYALVQDYCNASNKLEVFLKNHQYQSLHAGLISVNGGFYIDFNEKSDNVEIVPNPYMITELRAMRKFKR